MRNKLWIAVGLIGMCLLYGCVKDLKKAGISETTILKGRILEESQRVPIPEVKVKVTNGETVYLDTFSGNDGKFKLEVDFDNIDKNSYIVIEMLDGNTEVTKRLELKGMGKETYDYNDIFLYNKNDNVVPIVTTNMVSEISENGAVCGGNVTSDGGAPVIERGICWAKTKNPTVSDNTANGGSGTGSFTCTMRNLSPNTKYYVRAYAINNVGIAYGASKDFTTLEAGSGNTVPVVTTNPVSAITATSAVCGGNVTSDGGTPIIRRGICWGTSPHPGINTSQTTDFHNNGTGSYSCTMTGLTPSTKYYVKAFAVNEEGVGYGEEKSFETVNQELSDWLYYGDGEVMTYWGLTNGGDDEWAVMFPSSDLSPYSGTNITKVRVYFYETGRYNLKFYEGGTSSPTTLKLSKSYDINSTGWKNLLINPGFSLNSSTNLWVSLSFSYEAGLYPRVAGDGINQPNARWAHSNGSDWHDAYDHNGGEDLCWIIQVYVTNEAKGGIVDEYELPLNVITSNSSEVPVHSSTSRNKETRKKIISINKGKANE